MNTGFASVHPAPCFVYYTILIILCMTIYHPVFLAIALISQVAINLLQDGGKRLKRSAKYYIFLGLMIVILNPFISHRGETILFYFADNPITLEAIFFGITMMMSLLTILIAFISYNMVITPDKFMYLFSSICPKIAFLSMISMRFVPLLKKRSIDIACIQQTRGSDITSGNLIDRVKNGMRILNILVTWSLEDAIVTARSMRARGYGVTKKRSSYFDYRLKVRDVFYLLAFIIIAGGIFYFWNTEQCYFQIYPKVSDLRFNTHTVLFLLSSLIFLGIPIILEGMEKIQWQIYK